MKDENGNETRLFIEAEPMLKVLALCEATKRLAHELHYGAKGKAFYGLHLLADRADFGDAIDGLKETYYLGSIHSEVPTDCAIGAIAAEIVENAKESYESPVEEDDGGQILVERLFDVAKRGAYSVEDAKRILSPFSGVCVHLDEISRVFLVVSALASSTARRFND